MKMKLSENFNLSEFVDSPTAKANNIDNTPSEAIIENLTALVETVLQPTRTLFGEAMHVNSGYRCLKLNELVGGVNTGTNISQHTKGEAADIKTSDPIKLFKWLRTSKLPFDQIILYPTFVHISHKKSGINRGQVLYAKGVKAV